MIDVSNLKDVLNTLGFVAHGDMYEKAFLALLSPTGYHLCQQISTLFPHSNFQKQFLFYRVRNYSFL